MGYFGWVDVGGPLFWVGGCRWGCMGHYFEWVGVDGDAWGIILKVFRLFLLARAVFL